MWQGSEQRKANKELSERWRVALDTSSAPRSDLSVKVEAVDGVSSGRKQAVEQIRLELQEIRRKRAILVQETVPPK